MGKEKIKKKIVAAVLGLCMLLAGICHVQAGTYARFQTLADSVKAASAKDDKTETKIDPKAWKKINGVCYNGVGKVIPGAITRGIDVSSWQDVIDWQKVKNSDVDFAFIRLAHGIDLIDKYFDYNMSEAIKAGIPVGIYVYSTATTKKGALKEAQLAIKKMDGYKISYPVVYDLEYSEIEKLSKKEVADLALTFCNEVRNAGYYPMIYSNVNWYDHHIDWSKLGNIDVWIAKYGDDIDAPDKSKYKYTIWQSTDGDGDGRLNPTKGLVDGIPIYNNSDMDFGYVDYTKIIVPRTKALSTYKPATTPNTNTIKTPQLLKNGWITENGKTYYYKDDVPYKGTRMINGKYYCFHSTKGYLFRDVLLKSSNGSKVCYADKNGVRVTKKWVTKGGKTYFMGADGYAFKGSRKVGSNYYIFSSKYCYMFKNFKRVTSDKSIYYYDETGRRCKNEFVTIKENGKNNTYYFGQDGKAVKGWQVIDGQKYYFNVDSAKQPGVMAKNKKLANRSGLVSVFDKNGICIEQYQK